MKTTQINNKHYQECDVVMLATNTATGIVKFKIGLQFSLQNKVRDNNEGFHLYILLNDEIKVGDWCLEKTGLGFLNPFQMKKEYLDNQDFIIRCKKIIATTNSSICTGFAKSLCPECDSKMKVKLPDHLECINCKQQYWNLASGVYNETCKLPQIPQSFITEFIESYNRGNVINKVLVEVESDFGRWVTPVGMIGEGYYAFPDRYKIKLNQNNEVSILTKEETLEEAAERLFSDFLKENPIIPKSDFRPYKLGFITGTIWQAQRMSNNKE